MKLDSKAGVVELLKQMAEAAPKMLRREEPEYDPTILSFWLGKDLANKILFTLDQIRWELVPNHAEDTLILIAFWDELVCEVSDNPQVYIDAPHALHNLVDQFGDRWKRPLAEFQVVYSVEYLEVGQEPITLLGVDFFAPTDEALTERAIPPDEISQWVKEGRTITLAATEVMAASSTAAAETGRNQVVDAVALLRASALCGLFGRTDSDEPLQWRISGHCLMKPVVERAQHKWSWAFRRPFGPLVIDLGDHIRQGIGRLRLERLDDTPTDIRDRLTRSIYWIARSATHEVDDHKIVDLFTALEILLLPEERAVRNKGAVLALRYSLLGGCLNPPALNRLYERRNNVIHGRRLPVVGPSDTWHLRSVCYETVGLIVSAAIDAREHVTLEALMATLETEETLTEFLERAGHGKPPVYGMYEGSLLPRIVKEARERRKRVKHSHE